MKSLNLKPSNGSHQWCGPTAAAIALEVDYDIAYKKCLRARRKRTPHLKIRYIKGMSDGDLASVVRQRWSTFRFKYPIRKVGRLRHRLHTLNSLMDHLRPNRLYIVSVTGHYLTVNTQDWTVMDNWHDVPIPVAQSEHRLCRVRAYGLVRKL